MGRLGAEDDKPLAAHDDVHDHPGVNGTLNYRYDYKSGSVVTGDSRASATARRIGRCPDPLLDTSLPDNYGNKKCLWDDPESIDDFRHTAVTPVSYWSAAPGLGHRRPGRCARRRLGAARSGSAAAT